MQKKCFNDTRAVLEGRQTMFRSVIKCPSNAFRLRLMRNCVGNWVAEAYDDVLRPIGYIKPAYKVGEVVAIAQAYSDVLETMIERHGGYGEEQNEFYEKWNNKKPWQNKMLVLADLMPSHIKITDIKVERLQDISDEDCLREGIMEGEFMNTWDRYYFDEWGDVPNHITFKTPREAFAHLIDKVSGKGTWERNPWVFAYCFELVD